MLSMTTVEQALRSRHKLLQIGIASSDRGKDAPGAVLRAGPHIARPEIPRRSC